MLSAPGTLTLHDVGADGRALISRDAMRAGAIGLAPGENKERDLSWQDWTVPNDISEDGKLVLFVEAGEAGGGDYAAFSRETNGASAVRLGEGSPIALSPDGKWALVLRQNMSPPDSALLPTGVGQERKVPTGNVIPNTGQFFPDSKRGLFSGHEPGHASRVYVKNLDGGQPRPITPKGFRLGPYTHSVSPDGKRIASITGDGIALLPVDGGELQALRGSQFRRRAPALGQGRERDVYRKPRRDRLCSLAPGRSYRQPDSMEDVQPVGRGRCSWGRVSTHFG